MDYFNACLSMFGSLFVELFDWCDIIFRCITPLGMGLISGLIIMYVVYRYIISPFLR